MEIRQGEAVSVKLVVPERKLRIPPVGLVRALDLNAAIGDLVATPEFRQLDDLVRRAGADALRVRR